MCSRQSEAGEYVNLAAYRWSLTVAGPTRTTRAVFQELARRSDDYGCCHVSRRVLAEKLGWSPRTIDGDIAILVRKGLIRRIGRYAAERGQVTSITQVCAWPGRKRIPASGHPRYGKGVKEDVLDDLVHARANLKNLQGARARTSGHIKNTDELKTTTESAGEAVLDACLSALGRWADERNRRFLRLRLDTLSELLAMGADLETDVLPVLRQMSKREGDPPVLRTWMYFAEPIRKRAERRKDRQRDTALDGPLADDPSEDNTASSDPTPSSDEAVDVSREMDRFLRSVAKGKRFSKTGDGS